MVQPCSAGRTSAGLRARHPVTGDAQGGKRVKGPKENGNDAEPCLYEETLQQYVPPFGVELSIRGHRGTKGVVEGALGGHIWTQPMLPKRHAGNIGFREPVRHASAHSISVMRRD